MTRKTPILYLLLIGVPALVLTLAAVGLLMGVREQVVALEQEGYRAVAEKVSDELTAWLATVQEGLLEEVETLCLPQAQPSQQVLVQEEQALPQQQGAQVRSADDSTITQGLRNLQRQSPFVRNVFIWEKGRGVLFPVAARSETEEQRFLLRFAPLFKGDYAWQENGTDKEVASGSVAKSELYQSLQALSPRVLSSRTRTRATPLLRSAWIPWFEGNQLHLLGWLEVRPGRIAGIELEMSAVLSRLQPMIEPWTNGRGGGQGLELTDGHTSLLSAGVLAAADNRQGGYAGKPVCEWPIGPLLPHWVIKVYPRTDRVPQTERAILLIGGVLLLLLVSSLAAGGFLLVRDAARQRQESFQKTSFVSNVSHELKTPLTSIRMYAELLADGKAATQETMKQYLGVIVTESERLTRLVNNVLDFGRLEQKRRAYHCETLNLHALVCSAVEPLRGIVESADMKLELVKEADAFVKADRDALNRVLVNLVDNACKYATEGKSVEITIGKDKGQAFIRVADRGPGVPKVHAKRIFERFFRVDDSVTASVGGSGLGLSIAKQLMHGMGGDVQFNPREGGGSLFTVTLPMEENT